MTELDAQTQQHTRQQRDRDYYEQSPERPALLNLLKEWLGQRSYAPDNGPRILDVGCGRGWVAQQLRQVYSHAVIDGIELNQQACLIAREHFRDLYEGSVEAFLAEQRLEYQYDYILFGDILEHLHDPWAVLPQFKAGLKQEGRMVVSLPNVGHFSIILNLLKGQWQYTEFGLLDRTHLRFFTLQAALQMITDAGLSVDDLRFTGAPQPEIIDQMAALAANLGADPNRFKQEAQAFQYIFLLSPSPT